MKRALGFIALAAAAAIIIPASAQTRPAATSGPAHPIVVGPDGLAVYRNVEYAKADGNISLRMDICVPAGGKPLPLVVWIHGGAWVEGDKQQCGAIPLVKRGYAVASINYRFSQQAIFPAQIHDCKGAIRFLRANAAAYNIDANHIGVWGASAGGHLAALLGTTAGNKEVEGSTGGNEGVSSAVQAVCDFFGPADFVTLSDSNLWIAEANNSPVTKLLGGPISRNRKLAALASPVTHASKNAGPFLILHGDKDTLVPLPQSQALHEALLKAGAKSTLKVIPGAGHGFAPAQIGDAVETFFNTHLKIASAKTQK